MFAFKRISSSATILLLFCCTFFLTHELEAQAPEGVNYQAVARNNAGDPLANQIISVRFSVIATNTSGALLYEEEHSTISTNDFGLFNLVIGRGNRTGGSAANFAGIDWSSGNRFLRVAVDAGSGFENLGTTQLLSVPYALYAKTSGNASSNLRGGDGITIRNDSIINAGDLSETNELITSFSLETGNVLRITEASTNYDVDLTPLLSSSTDDQNLRFSSNGDSILIDDGDGIEIQFILDDIADNAADILTNQSDIANNTQGLIDSARDIRDALEDSTNVLKALILAGSDNQNLSIVGDSIVIERGSNIGIGFITDSISSYNTRIGINATGITNNAQGLIDSARDIRDALEDSTSVLKALILAGSDNQNLSIVGDSIVIERGSNIGIGFITDSISSYNTRIGINATDIANNTQGIIDSSTSTRTMLADSSSTLRALITSDNDADSTNELITGIGFVGRRLEINQQGGTVSLDFDTLFNSRRLNLSNRITLNSTRIDQNRDSINAVVDIINGLDGGVFEKVGGVIRDTSSTYDSDFVIGSPQLDGDAIAAHRTRMFFDKSKSSFRAGRVDGSQWDDSNIGSHSTAFGWNNTASGNGSAVLGGSLNIASSGPSAVIGGGRNTASGNSSVVIGGSLNVAGGLTSVAFGIGNRAQSRSEFVLGEYNDTLSTGFNTNSFISTDRLLVIGNGTADNARSNALVILKSGNVGIGTSSPDSLLEVNGGVKVSSLNVNGAYTFPTTDGIGEQFLQTDGGGNISWSSTVPTPNCPTGMTNVQGNICIETNEQAASNWYAAARRCASLGYKLPTWAEWYGAATNAVLTNETNNWEWVSDGTSNTARKVGNTDLKNTANDDPETGSANFRCIFYK